MAENIHFPTDLFHPNDVLFTPNFRNTSGGVSLSGATQVIGSASGIWEATIFASKIRNSRFVQMWEVLELRAEGRLNGIIVPVCGRRKLRAKTTPDTATSPYTSTPHSDTAFFADNVSYVQDSLPVIAPIAMNVGARSGEFLFFVDIEPIEAGFFFSITDRLYRITAVEPITKDRYFLKFWPRLREVVPAGAEINFSSPNCKMRLKTDKEMAVEKNLHRFAQPDVELIEYL